MIPHARVVALPTAAELHAGPAFYARVITNSREVGPGDLFVALLGARDGHGFVEAAIAAGAAGVLVSRPIDTPPGVGVVQVADTLQALRDLGVATRAASNADVLALTGSVGKTTTKDVLAHVLAAVGTGHVLATPKSYNNHLGVPLTLTMLTPETTDLIAEVGTNHPGEIADLVSLIQPRAALVTNVGHAHLGNFESREALADEKVSIFKGVRHDGVWFVNADDLIASGAVARLDRPSQTRLVTYGTSAHADVRVSEVAVDEAGTHGLFGDIAWSIPLVGAHFATTVAGVFAVALERGLDAQAVADALATFPGSPGRAEISVTNDGRLRIIDDTYNGSPDSMLAGLATLGSLPETRRIAVLGEMVELGDWSEPMHRAVGEAAARHATDLVFAGPSFDVIAGAAIAAGMSAGRIHQASSATEAGAIARGLITDQPTAVFVKGSRFSHMERVVLMLEGVAVGCTLQRCELYIHCRTCPQLLG